MTWDSDLIIPGNPHGNVRSQAEAARLEDRAREFHARGSQGSIHGMTSDQAAKLNERFAAMMPRLATSNPNQTRRDLFSNDLPKALVWDPRRQALIITDGFCGKGQLSSSSGGGRN